MFLRKLSFIIISFLVILDTRASIISNAVLPVYYFSGRMQELKQIDELFAKESVVSIVGISGIGKTELARRYVAKRAKQYDIVWFFDMNSDLKLQFQQLAKQINLAYGKNKKVVSEDLEECIESIRLFLGEKKQWLFVLDNLKIGENEKILDLVRHNNRGKFLILSQDKHLLQNLVVVLSLNYRDSKQVIQNISPRISDTQTQELYDRFLGYPLPLVQSAYFTKDNGEVFLASFEKECETNFQELMSKTISSLSKQELKLLIKAANLNNHLLTHEIMLKISDDKNDLFALNRINFIIEKNNNEQRYFEMHDLIKDNLLSIVDKGVIKDNVENLVDQANSIFPRSEHLYIEVLNKYPNIINNLEHLLENAERQNIDIYKILELRKNLLNSNISSLNYKPVKNHLDWFQDNKKELLRKEPNDSHKAAISTMLFQMGAYKNFVEDKFSEAKKAFDEAIKIVEEIDEPEVKFEVYEQYAETLVCTGNVNEAHEKINVAEKIFLSNPSNVNKAGLTFSLAKIFLEKGEYEVALKNIEKSKQEVVSNNTYVATTYELEATILLRQGEWKKAHDVCKKYLDLANKSFDTDHDLKNRALIFLAWSEAGLGHLKEAEEHINTAKKFFLKQKTDTERSGGEYMAYMSIVQGDIALNKHKYKEAMERYIEAEVNLKKIYTELKNDFYGLILERIVTAASLAKRNVYKVHYILECKNVFGSSDSRLRRMQDFA